MARKSQVLNIRVTEAQRDAYERAAMLEHTTVSGLVTGAADIAAADVLSSHSSMTVPSDVYDRLLHALDEPTPLADPLARAFDAPAFENH